MRETFNLGTKFGTVFFIVNGANEIYVSSSKRENYGPETYADITIRGKRHKNLNLRFGLHPDGTLDGRTYGHDGNTVVFVKDHNSEYFEARAVHLNEDGGFKESSHAAKIALYREIKQKLNEFYQHSPVEIDREFAARQDERREAKINELKEKIVELEKQLKETKEELAIADKQLDSFREV